MGKVTAMDLIKQGHIVYTAARRLEQMEDIKNAGGFPIFLDITKDESVEALVAEIERAHGRLDVLWNNAGFGLFGSIEETSLEEARYQFDVNLFGLARITQLVLPLMRKHKKGLIINTSSMGGKVYTPLGGWYHATKHALEGFSDCLRIEVAPHGIDVAILEPGVIKTEFGDVMTDAMLKRSGTGPYGQMAQSVAKMSRESYEKNSSGSPASLISKTVQRIIESPRPKTRYLVGKYAKPMVAFRNLFGDRAFDGLLRVMVK